MQVKIILVIASKPGKCTVQKPDRLSGSVNARIARPQTCPNDPRCTGQISWFVRCTTTGNGDALEAWRDIWHAEQLIKEAKAHQREIFKQLIVNIMSEMRRVLPGTLH